MSHFLYSENKTIGYFSLVPELANKQQNAFLKASTFVTTICHIHYPCIYYQAIFQHYCIQLQQYIKENKFTKDNIRIIYKNKQLPNDIPIGLYFDEETTNSTNSMQQFEVHFVKLPCMDSFRVIKNIWKRAFQVININRRCDYVKSRLSQQDLRKKYYCYVYGKSNNLHSEGLYEGTHILLRGFYKGQIIQRKFQAKKQKLVYQLLPQIFPILFRENQLKQEYKGKVSFWTHGVKLPQLVNCKDFLDLWNYNDGYCYIKLRIEGQMEKQQEKP